MEGDRRQLLKRAWIALSGLATGQVAWIAVSFLKPRPGAVRATPLFVAGPVDRFAAGTVSAFPDGRFYLVRLRDGGFLALHRECTHLGCTVPWDSTRQRFACPCHASSFDITGAVLSAPAPRPLDLYAVRVENGLVKVDLERRTQRQAFEPSQVVA